MTATTSAPLNHVMRLRSVSHSRQTLLSAVTQALVHGQLPTGAELRDRQAHCLKHLILRS